MFLQLLQHSLNSFHKLFSFGFGINEDVIEVYYHKNVKLLWQNLIIVALNSGRCIGQSKTHQLVLEIAIADLENCLLFIIFSHPYLMVSIDQIELGKTLSPI